jgi:hypothetical protein
MRLGEIFEGWDTRLRGLFDAGKARLNFTVSLAIQAYVEAAGDWQTIADIRHTGGFTAEAWQISSFASSTTTRQPNA